MTEADWLTCLDPHALLAFLDEQASDRKMWLLACASCRKIPGFCQNEDGRKCLEVVARFADGAATREELLALRENYPWDIRWYRGWPRNSAYRALESYIDGQWSALPSSAPREARDHAGREAKYEIAHLVREIFGNPFRPVFIDPYWLAANDGAAIQIARNIYEEHAFDGMPILADALEDAGCTDERILGHCRDDDEHARGCWVVDALLAKE